MRQIIKMFLTISDKVYNILVFWWRQPVYDQYPLINGKLYLVSEKRKIYFGKNVKINSCFRSNPIGGNTRTVLFAEPSAEIRIGNNVGISNSAFHAAKLISVGNNVMIGGDCKIYDTDFHSVKYEDRMQKPDIKVKSAPVVIQDGVFIGTGSMILKGVTIGEKSVVAAGSIVTKQIPPHELWGGCTGKIH